MRAPLQRCSATVFGALLMECAQGISIRIFGKTSRIAGLGGRPFAVGIRERSECGAGACIALKARFDSASARPSTETPAQNQQGRAARRERMSWGDALCQSVRDHVA